MFPQLERVTFQLAAAGLVGSATLGGRATDFGERLLEGLPPEVIFVGWVIGATIIAITFAVRYGRRITRTPSGELSRFREELLRELASVRATRAEHERRREQQLEKLDARLDGLTERVARIEGELRSPVLVNGKRA